MTRLNKMLCMTETNMLLQVFGAEMFLIKIHSKIKCIFKSHLKMVDKYFDFFLISPLSFFPK